MNHEIVEMEPLECEAYQTKEVLKVLLHSIVYQRALGECRFCECESNLLIGVPYVRCSSHAICQRVDDCVENLSSELERIAHASPAGVSARIFVAFVERRCRPGTFGLFRGEERVTWERWHIALAVRSVHPPAAPAGAAECCAEGRRRRQQKEQLAVDLRARLEMILTTASSRKEHIPPADGLGGGDPTWFEITSDAGSGESWGGAGFGDLFKLARRLGDTIATT